MKCVLFWYLILIDDVFCQWLKSHWSGFSHHQYRPSIASTCFVSSFHHSMHSNRSNGWNLSEIQQVDILNSPNAQLAFGWGENALFFLSQCTACVWWVHNVHFLYSLLSRVPYLVSVLSMLTYFQYLGVSRATWYNALTLDQWTVARSIDPIKTTSIWLHLSTLMLFSHRID